MDSLPKRPNAPPSPPRRGPRHVSPPTVQRPGPSSWEPAPRARSPQSWDREPPRGRPMFRPRSRSRSRSFEFEYDFQPRRSPPPPPQHPHSRLPRRAWERSRSRSPPPPPKSTVLCKYFSRPTGCDKGNRCRFRHQRARSRSFSRSRSYSRTPPPRSRSRSPPLHYRRGESPMLIPRGGLRASPPSLLQRMGPLAAPMRQASPIRTRPVSRDGSEPLEEGEERSPGRKARKPRGGRGRRRPEREREKGNWDSFVASDEDLSGNESRRMLEPRRGRSRSRSPRTRTGSASRKSKSRSRSPPGNPKGTLTRSSSREKRSHQLSPRSPTHSRSRSRSRSPRSRALTSTPDQTPRSRSHTRSRSRSTSPRRSRSRSRSSYRRSRLERESWAERDRKNASPAPNPSSSSATITVSAPGPTIPTGPRWRAPTNSSAVPAAPRTLPGPARGGPPPTGPRGDREPPRGPRNMIASALNPAPSAPSANPTPGVWDRPQSSFQSYLAAVQSKLVAREVKKKEEEDTVPTDGAEASGIQTDPNAMDVDVKEEPVASVAGSHLNTPVAELSREGSWIASPAHPNAFSTLTPVHVSPASGQGIPLPAPPPHLVTQTQTFVPHPAPHPHVHPLPLPLPPRPRSPPRAPRSPPRGPRATRGLPEKPKAMGGPDLGRAERDRDRDSAERGRDRNVGPGAGGVAVAGGEVERKVHALPTNPARRPRMPTVRATKREVLFPELEKEIASLEDQRARLANEHLPHAIAFRQAVHDLTLSAIDYRAAEDRRVMTEAVLEAMVKGGGVVATGDV